MTEIKDHKTFWKRSTMEIITFTEGSLADIIQLARNDINSLITTIESQQKEKDKQHDEFYNEVRIAHQEKEMSSHRHALYAGELREKIESQKEEIKLLREACIEFTHVHFRRPAPLYPTIYEPAYKMAVTALLPMQEGENNANKPNG